MIMVMVINIEYSDNGNDNKDRVYKCDRYGV